MSESDALPSSIIRKLKVTGIAYVIVSFVIAIGCVAAAGLVTREYGSDDWGERGISWLWIGLAIIIAAQGFAVDAVLVGLAEIIIQQRRTPTGQEKAESDKGEQADDRH